MLDENEMENLEEWSSSMDEKMVNFDVVDRLKVAVINIEKKEKAKVKHEENIIQNEMFRRIMLEEFKIQWMKFEINKVERVWEER